MKRVRITIEADSHFVRMLNANVELSALRGKDDLQPIDVLALMALGELRGALPEEVYVPPEWRGHLGVVSEARVVEELTP